MVSAGLEPVVVVTGQAVGTEREQQLAQQLGLSLLAFDQLANSGFQFYLRYANEVLGLYRVGDGKTGAVCVDFSSAALRHRVADGLRKQALLKAVGVKGGVRPSLLDATAGLGRDSYLLASAGCEVVMLERSAIVHALLEDGMNRALLLPQHERETVSRLRLHCADFLTAELGTQHFDVVYLDPMFPESRQRALVKKELQVLKELLGAQNGEGLLTRARTMASKRVVVKRARKSPNLEGETPQHSFSGSSSRYDVYFT